jgi:GH25 family lysozyme M1 (1,4-beta-N-acetylmuramidase)
MKKIIQNISAAALAVCFAAGSVLPANAAPTFQHSTSVSSVTVSGHPLTDKELSKGSYLINLVKGCTVYFDVKSGNPVNFVSGNGQCASTGTKWSYNSANHTSRYTITGRGKVGETCGLYLDHNRTFQAKIIERPHSQPFTCDTTDPVTKKVGETYKFELTLKDPHSNATFVVGNSSTLSTYAPPGTSSADGSKTYYYSVMAKNPGCCGIYVIVDGVSYRAFIESVVSGQNHQPPDQPTVPDTPNTPDLPSKPTENSYTYTPKLTSSSGTNYINGVDVSEWRGDIDWEAAKKAGVRFAMLRVGYGLNNIDKSFVRNISECNRLGIPVGAYWYSYAWDEDSAAQEAQDCLDAIKDYRVEYPVCFDFEDCASGSTAAVKKEHGITVDKTLATKMANAFCHVIENNHYYAMNYSNLNDLNTLFDKDELSRYDLWYAQYPGITDDSQCEIQGPHMWQYASDGTVSGIPGNVDMDVSTYDYAAMIRSAGLNHLSSGVHTHGSSGTIALSKIKIPSGTDASAPKSGQMSQPGYTG